MPMKSNKLQFFTILNYNISHLRGLEIIIQFLIKDFIAPKTRIIIQLPMILN